MSDIHIDSANTDLGKVKEELQEAKRLNDRIFINGDLFDLVIAKDFKRYRQSSVRPEYQGRDDLLNASCDNAEKLLDPYRENIDGIGVGNHEDSILKYCSYDPAQALISRLNRSGSPVQYMDYTGFITQRFECANARITWKGFYHHGSGGSSQVTKGIISFQRKSVWLDGVHLIWEAHKHNRFVDTQRVVMGPSAQGYVSHYDRYHIMSGSYMDTFAGSGDKGPRRGSYAEDWGVGPQSKGGWRLVVTARHKRIDGRKSFVIDQKVEG